MATLLRKSTKSAPHLRSLTRLPTRGIVSAASAIQEYPRHDLPPEPLVQLRREAIKNAKPFSAFLTDTFQRQHDYLRISLTEKCNLRCLYCMPEEGVPQSPPRNLLTTPEIYLLSSTFVSQGVTKIRLTGGEPTVRKDILPLMHQIGSLRSQGLKELCLTTNGISLHRKLDSMAEAGLTGVNLSLDTLDPWQFQIMTRRKGFEAVMRSINRILEMNKLGAGIKLKINCVVMRGMNEREIIPFVELGREQDLEVRFIEYMPFDGNKWSQGKMLSFQEMLDMIRGKYPGLRKVQDHKNDTSKTYEIPGFAGRIGFITSMTHNFCGSCNRLRITSDGNLKVCLFGNDEVSLRDMLRKSNNGNPIDEEAFEAMKQIEMDRRQSLSASQGPLGGTEAERALLEVIGIAVKGKKEKHAGMGELENMKNRPMILIDKSSTKMSSSRPYSRFPSESRSLPPWKRIPTHLLAPSVSSHIRLYSSRSSPSANTTTSSTPPDAATPKLTHLTPSGTAHMVAISHKSPTTRLATAVCTLHFSNPTALPLIRSNNMKKGDVLSVARIAGIMAAKRTADLVPLCHPIAITHVSVALEVVGQDSTAQVINSEQEEEKDVERKKERVSVPWQGTGQGDAYPFHVVSPKAVEHQTKATAKASKSAEPPGSFNDNTTAKGKEKSFGSIKISATVQCDGKTGVEMEALTAASVAALTVYDMCKAVDKGMRIEGLKVVRKEGGKSGTWVEGESVE